MSPKYHLLDLPDEVLLSMVINLSLSGLLSFMHSCRRFSVMIAQSPLMQYLIRVMRNGLYDPLITDMSIPQRVEGLEIWERAWLGLSLRDPSHRYRLSTIGLDDPKPCRVQNGILISSRLNDLRSSGSYYYLDFSHLLGQSSVVSRINIPNVGGNAHVQSWTYVPESDLIAIIFQYVPTFLSSGAMVMMVDRADRRRGPPKLQFHQFSTGNKHPSAANYSLEFDQILTARETCVDCCGENMAVVILDGENMGGRKDDYVFLVEWKIGRITQVSSFIIQCYLHPDSQTSCKWRNLERMVLWSPFCPATASFLPYETPSRFKFVNYRELAIIPLRSFRQSAPFSYPASSAVNKLLISAWPNHHHYLRITPLPLSILFHRSHSGATLRTISSHSKSPSATNTKGELSSSLVGVLFFRLLPRRDRARTRHHLLGRGKIGVRGRPTGWS